MIAISVFELSNDFCQIFYEETSKFRNIFWTYWPLHQYLWSEISRQWNNGRFNFFFEICMEERFASYILSNKGNIKASILLKLLKCIVVGYSNGNEIFTGKLFSNYGPLNMLLHFFRYLIYSVFHETFVKKFMKKLFFFSSNFKNPF